MQIKSHPTLRTLAQILLSLVWFFPLLAIINRSLFPDTLGPLLPPTVGLLDSNRTLLLILASGAYLLACPMLESLKKGNRFALAFLVCTVASSLLGESVLNSLFFSMTWWAGACVFSAACALLPGKWGSGPRVLFFHLPCLVVAAYAMMPVAAGQSLSVSEPFQLGNVYSNWQLLLLPFLLQDLIKSEGKLSYLSFASSAFALSALALTFSRTSTLLTCFQVCLCVLVFGGVTSKRLLGWLTILGGGLIIIISLRAHLGGALLLVAVMLLVLLPPLYEAIINKTGQRAVGKISLTLGAVALIVFFVQSGNPDLDIYEKATGRLDKMASGDGSTLSRTEFWLAAWQNGLTHPLLGSGPGNFAQLYPKYQKRFYFYQRLTPLLRFGAFERPRILGRHFFLGNSAELHLSTTLSRDC